MFNESSETLEQVAQEDSRSPSLETPKSVYRTLSNLKQWKMSLLILRGIGPDDP